jgi:hypothetical protein
MVHRFDKKHKVVNIIHFIIIYMIFVYSSYYFAVLVF